jgi:hypothetical protein
LSGQTTVFVPATSSEPPALFPDRRRDGPIRSSSPTRRRHACSSILKHPYRSFRVINKSCPYNKNKSVWSWLASYLGLDERQRIQKKSKSLLGGGGVGCQVLLVFRMYVRGRTGGRAGRWPRIRFETQPHYSLNWDTIRRRSVRYSDPSNSR